MRKQLVILILCGLMLSLSTAFIHQIGATDSNSSSESTQANTTATVFAEGFEGAFPGSWSVGDSNAASGLDYWYDTNYIYHTGSWSGWCAQSGIQSTSQIVWSENFEGAFPGTSWYVTDQNSANGYDYWDDTTYIRHAGSWGGWCAQVGTHARTVTIFTENFEGAFPGTSWYVGDWNSANGYDYWDDTSYWGGHAGSWSGWCAQVGTQAVGPIQVANSAVHTYDNYMNSYMYRYVGSLTGYTSVSLSYWWALNCESSYDYLQVMYYDASGWHYVDTHTGNAWAWHYSTVAIPTTATYVGFRFYSDATNHNYQGALIDDISFYATQVPNTYDHVYDDNMDSVMYRYAVLSGYASVTLSYWWALNCESSYDYLQVMYYAGGTWHYIDTHTGNLWSWHYSTVTIPTTATYVGFKFHSDNTNHNYQGAYIDDISLSGYAYNSAVHQYDNNMDAYMYRSVGSLTGYTSVSLSYYWALNCESSYDYLQVMYYAGGTWYYIDTHTGNLWSWHYSTVAIPTTATYVGFRFHSDSTNHNYAGAYIDDIVCTGVIAGPLFSDGFESGSFSAWTGGGTTTGETRAVTTTAHPVYQGSYAAQFTSNGGGGTEQAYCYKTIAAQTNLYARGYFRVSTNGATGVDDRFFFITFRAGTTNVAYAGWKKTAAGTRWVLQIRDGTSLVSAYSSTAPSTSTWYRVELHWLQGTSGGAELFVNGVRVCLITPKNTAYYGSVNSVRMGLYLINCASTKVYADNAALSTTYIGP